MPQDSRVRRVFDALNAENADCLEAALAAAPRAVNEQSVSGMLPLELAIQKQHVGLVRVCLAAGADTDRHGRRGPPPLHCAVISGRLDVTQALIDGGADVNLTYPAGGALGQTALYWCARSGAARVARVLLDAGARADVPDSKHYLPIHLAASAGHQAMVDLLLAHDPEGRLLGRTDDMGATPLHFAAAAGHEEIVRSLLAAGAPLEARNHVGETPLMEACAEAQGGAVEILLGAGANPTIERGPTLVLSSASRGDLRSVKALLSAGDNPNRRDGHGRTALHGAARFGYAEITKALLAAGADPTPVTDEPASPSEIASRFGHPELAEILSAHCRHQALHRAHRGAPGPESGPAL